MKTGDRLGVCEITAALGVGGMGEVWPARGQGIVCLT